MVLFVLLGILALGFGAVTSQNTDGLYELNIVHFNDFHAHFDEVSPEGTACNPSEAPCVGGFARLYTAVQQSLEAEPESIVLNGGDTFQGTIWYNFLRWNVSQHFMNLLPHDAHVLGNHEFDHGIEGLLPYLERLNAPMLGANVNSTFEPEIGQYIKNHVIITRQGRRIGIIGVLLRVFSAPIGDLIIEDEVTAINREAAILTEQGVDIIIVLSHVGFDSDLNMAQRVSADVDIIVGAHSHTFLYTGEPPSTHTPFSDYPTVVTRTDGHRIPVVQASCYTRYLGNIKLFIDDNGIVQGWEGQPIFLGTSIIQDPQMVLELQPWKESVDAVGKEVLGVSLVTLNRSWCRGRECNMGSWACDGFLEEVYVTVKQMVLELQPWKESVDAVGKEVLGVSLVTLNRSWCRGRECNMGSWACDGFLEELMSMATGDEWNYAHVCLINSGGLRVQIAPGNVTTEALLMAMPFENYVQVYDLKGEYLLEALEFSVAVSVSSGSLDTGRMLQIGGMRVVYNISQPIGSRVASARIRCIDCDVPEYLPLDVNATYRVVSQDYIGEGGSGFTMLAEHRENLIRMQVDYVLMQDHMRRQGTVVQDLDGRIQVVT